MDGEITYNGGMDAAERARVEGLLAARIGGFDGGRAELGERDRRELAADLLALALLSFRPDLIEPDGDGHLPFACARCGAVVTAENGRGWCEGCRACATCCDHDGGEL